MSNKYIAVVVDIIIVKHIWLLLFINKLSKSLIIINLDKTYSTFVTQDIKMIIFWYFGALRFEKYI